MEFRYVISNKWNKNEIELVLNALEFVAKFYNLKTGVTTVKLIASDVLDATAEKVKNNRFEIRLAHNRCRNESTILRALFHEMTHVKQYMQNGFSMNGQTAKWNNETFKDFDYWFSPWEMEARAMEEALEYKFREEY